MRLLLPIVLTSLALTAGCGSGGGGSGKKSAAAAISTAAPTFRHLDRTDQSFINNTPVDGLNLREARDDGALGLLWAGHAPSATTRPAVDFSRETVVGVFLGQRAESGWGVEVVGVAEVSSFTYELSYVVTRPTGAPTGVPSRPAHIVAVDRTGGTFTAREVTPPVVTTPLVDVHGELLLAPTKAGGQTLAFLRDGETTPREVVDPSALTQAGARAGSTLTLSGDAEQNPVGATTLPEAVRVVTFAVDDVAATVRLDVRPGVVALYDAEGVVYEAVGPLAADLATRPALRPVRVTGQLDPARAPTIRGALVLRVSSHRPTTTITLRTAGGLLGVERVFAVDDLPVSGAYRFRDRTVVRPQDERRGDGALAQADRAALENLVNAAALRTQPAVFRPQFPLLDVPTRTLTLGDAQGDVTITIQYGASLPPALDALLRSLTDLSARAASFRTLEKGSLSGVASASVRVARDAAAWRQLWAAHAGSGPGAVPPTIDFTTSIVVAVFQGRQPSGGYGIDVKRLERAGDDLHLTVVRRTPAPGQPVTLALTAPYQFVVIDHQGATRDVWVDGRKQ